MLCGMEQLASRRERCDQRSFHDTILALGSVPLTVLEQRKPDSLPTGGVNPSALPTR